MTREQYEYDCDGIEHDRTDNESSVPNIPWDEYY